MDKIKALEYFTLGLFFVIIICGNLWLYTKSGAWKKIPAPDFNFYMQKDKYPI